MPEMRIKGKLVYIFYYQIPFFLFQYFFYLPESREIEDKPGAFSYDSYPVNFLIFFCPGIMRAEQSYLMTFLHYPLEDLVKMNLRPPCSGIGKVLPVYREYLQVRSIF